MRRCAARGTGCDRNGRDGRNAWSTLTIHDVATVPLGEGWALDGGWFQIDASEGGDPIAVGSFLLLCKQGEDGSWKMHWEVSNIQPLTG